MPTPCPRIFLESARILRQDVTDTCPFERCRLRFFYEGLEACKLLSMLGPVSSDARTFGARSRVEIRRADCTSGLADSRAAPNLHRARPLKFRQASTIGSLSITV